MVTYLKDVAIVILVLLGVTGFCVYFQDAITPKPREYPLWCHNGRNITASGLCKNIPGLQWAI